MFQREFKPGDFVVYKKTKHSRQPGPRAENIRPERRGDDYTYQVDKYWVVSDVQPDGSVVLKTRQGKENVRDARDPMLRPARWWERMLLAGRFQNRRMTMTSRNGFSGWGWFR